MNRCILYAVLLVISPIAGADAYKWTDADGRVHYSDRPPVDIETSEMKVRTGDKSGKKTAAEQPEQAVQPAQNQNQQVPAVAKRPEETDECAVLKAKLEKYKKGLIDFSYKAPSGRKIVPPRAQVIEAYEKSIAGACGESGQSVTAETETEETVAGTVEE